MTESTPTYVPIILHPLIRLAFLSPKVNASLQASGLEFEKDEAGFLCVKFDFSEKNDYKNQSLVTTLLKLNEMGIVFGEDFKQLVSPAGLMRGLQAKGILTTSFKSIAFGKPKFGDWMINDNPPK